MLKFTQLTQLYAYILQTKMSVLRRPHVILTHIATTLLDHIIAHVLKDMKAVASNVPVSSIPTIVLLFPYENYRSFYQIILIQ